MAKVTRILALLTIVALVAALPMSVVAQNDAPHIFIGTAIVNGRTATTGTCRLPPGTAIRQSAQPR